MYLVKGEINNTLLKLESKANVLVFNSLRHDLIIDESDKNKYLNFLYPDDLNENFFEVFSDSDENDLFLIDEYLLFQEKELWNKVKSISQFFNHVIVFNSQHKPSEKLFINLTCFESVFIHAFFFNLKFNNQKVFLICQSLAVMNLWIRLFQQTEISAKIHFPDSCLISCHELSKYRCHLFLSSTHIALENQQMITIFHFKTYKTNLEIWSRHFCLYNPELKVIILSLKKSNVWKDFLRFEKIEFISKALFHRLWEFLSV